jgi:hypothetical protein
MSQSSCGVQSVPDDGQSSTYGIGITDESGGAGT